ncbi:hypothetical protein B9Z19DRAFT_1101746 [Tuber borchii]|uniref:Uncharacterized protein n=1 Tax=Tuber borchii TaxID=42251 RepID=A0A2T6ZQB8_TUBBO|nr:hypothetical protein B9Z19DRAFT_1101746 [Tuber borchii]
MGKAGGKEGTKTGKWIEEEAGDSDVCVETNADFLNPSSKTVATRSSSFWTDALMKWGRPEERDILATFHVDDDELTCLISERTGLFESNAFQFLVTMTIIKTAIPVSPSNPAILSAPQIHSIFSLRDGASEMMIRTSSGNPTQPLPASIASTHEPVGNDV